LNELALFAGAGGGILGGKLLGWRTVCAVEIDEYARRVLLARQDDGCLEPFPVWDDVRTFDGRPWRGVVDVVSGGFPCQDISVAGKGEGIAGQRSGLWGSMARIIGEVEPRFVFVENVPALTSRGLGRVLGDLAEMGYDARWGVLGAIDAGAPHKRERIWIVAHDNSSRELQPQGSECEQRRRACDSSEDLAHAESLTERPGLCPDEPGRLRRGRFSDGCSKTDVADTEGREDNGRERGDMDDTETGREGINTSSDAGGEDVPDANGTGCEEQRRPLTALEEHEAAECGDWWKFEPNVGRVANGVASRVDRLRCIGNGQVPQVAAGAWRRLS